MMAEVNGAAIFVPARVSEKNDERPSAADMVPGGTSSVVFANRVHVGTSAELAQVGAKIDSIRKWTVNTFKNTKQQVFEQLGKIDRTIDPEFDSECERLKELHRRYGGVVGSAQCLVNVFEQQAAAEKALAESLYQLSLKEQQVKTQCGILGESLRKLGENASGLQGCLKFFLSSMVTVYEKSIADTLETMYTAEQARIEYDVARHEATALQSNPTAAAASVIGAKEKEDALKERYQGFKEDVKVKLRLLEENRIGVLTSRLDKLQSALAAYFSGNATELALSVEELREISPAASSFLQA